MSKRAGLPYLSVFDPDAKIAALYKVRATPTIVLIDRAGKVRHVGHRVDQEFRAVLREVLGSS
jgi:thioredoxin-related protein